jgi:hypothetical protein
MKRPRVLVVEDERSISEPLGAYLADEGFDVEVVADGQGGIEAAHRRPPDVILLDIGLPDVNGRDVCRTIRARSRVPIIMLTARGARPTASWDSSWAPTTTWSSPSRRRSSWPGCGPSCAVPAGPPPRRRTSWRSAT